MKLSKTVDAENVKRELLVLTEQSAADVQATLFRKRRLHFARLAIADREPIETRKNVWALDQQRHRQDLQLLFRQNHQSGELCRVRMKQVLQWLIATTLKLQPPAHHALLFLPGDHRLALVVVVQEVALPQANQSLALVDDHQESLSLVVKIQLATVGQLVVPANLENLVVA